MGRKGQSWNTFYFINRCIIFTCFQGVTTVCKVKILADAGQRSMSSHEYPRKEERESHARSGFEEKMRHGPTQVVAHAVGPQTCKLWLSVSRVKSRWVKSLVRLFVLGASYHFEVHFGYSCWKWYLSSDHYKATCARHLLNDFGLPSFSIVPES